MLRLRYLLSMLAVVGLLAPACGNEYDDDYSPDDDVADDDSATDDDDSSNEQQPDLFYDPPVLNFGSVCVGSSGVVNIAIANLGDAPLLIEGIVCPLPGLTFEPWTGSLPPGSSPLDIELTMTCSESGTFSSPFRIISNDPDEPQAMLPLEVACDC
jgi:hypothetical protein